MMLDWVLEHAGLLIVAFAAFVVAVQLLALAPVIQELRRSDCPAGHVRICGQCLRPVTVVVPR